ncbi:hypothetical protein KIL84_009728 [Mauremys mutica]|uniref:Uncharacterized protein n=1 Tax=Mauremys mutica TaxID=74926 RepID=A0A9D3XIB8_9SAUR|nr:hypothetical protein KIL84_009728 [Mauremys mutica]
MHQTLCDDLLISSFDRAVLGDRANSRSMIPQRQCQEDERPQGRVCGRKRCVEFRQQRPGDKLRWDRAWQSPQALARMALCSEQDCTLSQPALVENCHPPAHLSCKVPPEPQPTVHQAELVTAGHFHSQWYVR